MKLKDLTPNPRNPRKITDKKLEMLKKSLTEFGDLSGIVFNKKTGNLIGGHQRLKVLPPDAEIHMDSDTHGHVLIGSERFQYRVVEWDDLKEKAANISANKHGGDWDLPGLSEWLLELEQSDIDMDFTGFDTDEISEVLASSPSSAPTNPEELAKLYSEKIEAPIYTPKGEKPTEKELFDLSKTNKLLSEIRAANISEEIKDFLAYASHRHTVFSYEKIAEYYAHSSPDVQALMEKSALVIIDFKKAIENSFVSLTDDLAQAYQNGT